jgi:hypothetical protein
MADGIVGKISVGDGATFTPSVSSTGVLSWSNNKALANPDDFDIPEEVLNRAGAMGLATETWVSSELSKYLPIAGGTVTGNAIFNARTKFKSSIDFFEGNAEHGRIYDVGNVFRFTGGTSTSDGSYIDLSYTGGGTQQFRVVANDGTTQKLLVGKPDGTLTWDGNNIALAKDVLALSGGTVTGNIAANKQFFEITNTTLNGRNSIFGGTNSNNGAFLFVYGKDHSSLAGQFVLHANDGATTSELIGRPDGTLTWGGNNIALAKDYLPLTGGTVTGKTFFSDSVNFSTDASGGVIYKSGNFVRIIGGTGLADASQRSAYINLADLNSTARGQFEVNAANANSNVSLVGKPDGTLTWDGKNLKPNLVKLYESTSGASAGDTISLEKSASDFATFIIMVCDDLTDSAGSAFGIFCTRMKGSGEGSQFGSSTIRGGNLLNYSTSAVDMRMISIGISLNSAGTEATISNCSMVRINGTTNTFNARKVYAIYGMHLKSTIE